MDIFYRMIAALASFTRRADGGPSTALVVRQDAAGGVYNPISGGGMPSMDSGAASMPGLGYQLSYWDQDILYENNAYARKIISDLPEDATRKGWDVVIAGEVSREVAARDEELGLRSKIREAARQGRQYGGSWIWLIFDEEPNARSPEGAAYVNLMVPPRRVLTVRALHVLDPEECQALRWDGDALSPTYRDPMIYMVTPHGMGISETHQIHTSRLLYFKGVPLSHKRKGRQRGWHDLSVLQPAWAAIAGMTSADQSVRSYLQKLSIFVIKIAGLSSKSLSDQHEITRLRCEDATTTMSVSSALFLDEHDEASILTSGAAGIGDLHDRAQLALSAASDTPLTKLVGEAPGGLNADGEAQASTWREQIATYQADEIVPQLERYYGYALPAVLGVLPEDWEIRCRPLDEPTTSQLAATRKTVAETDAIYLDRGVYTPEQVRASRGGEAGWQLELVHVADSQEPTDADREAVREAIRLDASRTQEVA